MNLSAAKPLFLLGQKVLKTGYSQILGSLLETQYLERKKLEDLQCEKLEQLLNYAYQNVPYYKNLLKSIDLKPGQIQNLNDFRKIPLLDKETLQIKAIDFLSEKKIPHYRSKTGGSTGVPFEIYLDHKTRAARYAAQSRAFSWHGVSLLDPNVRIWGISSNYKTQALNMVKNLLANRKTYSIFKFSETTLMNCYHYCVKKQPVYLYGYSSGIYKFALFLKKRGLNTRRLRLKLIVATADPLFDFQKSLIEEVFSCKVVMEYGCTEAGLIAFECPKESMHISAENVLVEVLNNNEPADPGEDGDIVVTNLLNRKMPFIRYQLKDRAAILKESCLCGISLPLLSKIKGRSAQRITGANGECFYNDLYEKIQNSLRKNNIFIDEFKLIQRNKTGLSVLLTKQTLINQNIKAALIDAVNKQTNDQFQIRLELLDKLSTDFSGKTSYIASEIN